MVNGHFAPPYGPGGGFYVPQGGPVMGGKWQGVKSKGLAVSEFKL
jgi:hypothetical protein